MPKTFPGQDPTTRTLAYWRASLSTSLATLGLLVFVGSSIVAMLTSVGGAAILALLVTSWILTLSTAVRLIRFGRPGSALLIHGGLMVALSTLTLSVILLLGTVSGTTYIKIPLDLRRSERMYASALAMTPWRLPADERIDPVQAGLDVRRLSAAPGSTPTRPNHLPPIIPFGVTPWPGRWGTPLPAEVFPDLRSGGHLAVSIIDSIPRRLSPAERVVLDAVGTAPHWAAFARAARAPRIDLLSGLWALPLGDSVGILHMPIANTEALNTIARANAARIAYHLQRGERDAARTAAQELISLGLGLLDGSSSLMHALGDITLVAQGREQLARTLRVLGDPEAERVDSVRRRVAEDRARADTPPMPGLKHAATTRATVLRLAGAPTPPPFRWEMLRLLSTVPCTDTREIVLGPAADVRAAFDAARTDLARSAADSAWIEVAETGLEREGRRGSGPYWDRTLRIPHRIAQLLGSERLAGCLAFGSLP